MFVKTMTRNPVFSVLGLPQPPQFNATPQDLIDQAASVVLELRNVEDRLVVRSCSSSTRIPTFANLLQPLAYAESHAKREVQRIAAFVHLSPDPAVRKAATAAIAYIEQAELKSLMREDIFQLVQKVWENTDGLDSEDLMWLEKRRRDGIQKGLQNLPGETRQRFSHIGKKNLQLRSSFMENLTENQGSLLVLISEVHGVPCWYIRGLESRHNGYLVLPLKKPDITIILNTCQVSATRRKVFEAFENHHVKIVPIFKETIMLRDESARLLGYPNYAALRLESLYVSFSLFGQILYIFSFLRSMVTAF